MPVWLITGCATGFGRELAREVLACGWDAAVLQVLRARKCYSSGSVVNSNG
jgi:NAD(P)-dependent dehydrogenase (short-subunit alcohol dehydrogenase family)